MKGANPEKQIISKVFNEVDYEGLSEFEETKKIVLATIKLCNEYYAECIDTLIKMIKDMKYITTKDWIVKFLEKERNRLRGDE